MNLPQSDSESEQDRIEARVKERTAELARAREEASAAKEQLSMALEASRLALWDYDVVSGKLYLSDSWSEMLGRPRALTMTTIQAVTALVPESDREAVVATVARTLKGPDSSYRVEHRVNTAKGDVIWIVSEGRVVERSTDGRARRVIGTNRDISERMRNAVALVESESRFRSLTQLSSDWYWELDTELRFTRLEGAGLARLGIRAEEVIGGTALAFPRYELLSMSHEDFARVRAERRSYRDVRGRFSLPDGSHTYVSIAGEPVYREDGGFRGYRGVTRNITDQVRAETALAESEARFKGALENSAIGMALVSLEGRFLNINRALGQIFGYSREELLALTFQDITHPDDLDADLQHVREMLDGTRATYTMEKRYLHKRGHEVWAQLSVSSSHDIAGKLLYFISQIQDISARRTAEHELRASEERFRGAMQNSAIGMAILDLEGRWQKVNPALCAILGYSEVELLARTFQEITHPEDRGVSPERLRDLLAGNHETYQVEKRYVHKRGHEVWVQVNVSLVRDAKGRPLHLISQILDVSERRHMQQRIEHLALHDPLTDLPNSRLLADRLDQAMAAARRAGRVMGVMYVDLDGFKPVNDIYGHSAGDRVLKEFARRLQSVLRETDSTARVGEDEFVALLGEIAGEADAVRAAERLLAATALPFDIGENQVELSASIGIALYPVHGEDGQTLLQRADTAMYQAKRSEKNAYRLFARKNP